MVFDVYVLSIIHKLEGVYPAGTIDSCCGTQNEQKNTQNNVIEVEIRTLST